MAKKGRKETKIEQVDNATIETNVVEDDKPDAIMPYNKDVKRPYPHPKVQFFRPRISDWQTWHTAHRWWSDIDVEDQMKQVVYYFKHMKERTRFRIIDANGKIIKEVTDGDSDGFIDEVTAGEAGPGMTHEKIDAMIHEKLGLKSAFDDHHKHYYTTDPKKVGETTE